MVSVRRSHLFSLYLTLLYRTDTGLVWSVCGYNSTNHYKSTAVFICIYLRELPFPLQSMYLTVEISAALLKKILK